MNVRVFGDPPPVCNLISPGLVVRTFRFPAEVARVLATAHWSAGTAAVVDLGFRGLLGRDVITYIAERHPLVGLWGVTALCPRDWPTWATDRCRRVFSGDRSLFVGWLRDELDTFAKESA